MTTPMPSETQPPTPPVYGLILVGGYSHRMGRDKARLAYHEAPQFQHLFALLQRHCDQVFLSVRADQAADPDYTAYPCIVDAVAPVGPLAGVLSAMKAYPEAAFLVLACDLPCIDDAVVENLLAHRDSAKLATGYIIPHANFPEPLCTLYEPRAVLNINALYQTGKHSLRRFLLRADIVRLNAPDRWTLTNVNTPEDFQRLSERLSAEPA